MSMKLKSCISKKTKTYTYAPPPSSGLRTAPKKKQKPKKQPPSADWMLPQDSDLNERPSWWWIFLSYFTLPYDTSTTTSHALSEFSKRFLRPVTVIKETVLYTSWKEFVPHFLTCYNTQRMFKYSISFGMNRSGGGVGRCRMVRPADQRLKVTGSRLAQILDRKLTTLPSPICGPVNISA